MIDESPEAPQVEDTPAEETATAPQPEAEVEDKASEPEFFDEKFDPASLSDDLRPAYNQMRAAFTQKTQSLSEQRKEIEEHQTLLNLLRSEDPSEQALALHALGYDVDIPDDDDEPTGHDPDSVEDNELAELRQQLQELTEWRQSSEQNQEQQQVQQAWTEYVDESVDGLEKATGREFDEKELKILGAVAQATPDDDGLPDFRAAYEEIYGDLLPKERKKWLDGKQPSPSPGAGRSGTQQVDLSNDQDRIAHMARAIEAGGD